MSVYLGGVDECVFRWVGWVCMWVGMYVGGMGGCMWICF